MSRRTTVPLVALTLLASACADIPAPTDPGISRVQSSANSSHLGPLFYGDISDPSGDATMPPPPHAPADLVFGSASGSGGNVTLSVRFAPGAFSPATTHMTFDLDTDQNPATGHPGVASSGTWDGGLLGVEYVVTMGGAYYGSEARVLRYVGPPINTFAIVGSYPVITAADGMTVTVPMSAIGNDDGQMNFKVASAVQITSVGFTGILDVMTDVGSAPGSTRLLSVAVGDLNESVDGLGLPAGNARSMHAKIDAAIAALERGNVTAACNQLAAFVNQVNAFVANGTLTAAQGAALVAEAEELRSQIGC